MDKLHEQFESLLPFIATKLICRKTTFTCTKYFVAFACRKSRKINVEFKKQYAKFVSMRSK